MVVLGLRNFKIKPEITKVWFKSNNRMTEISQIYYFYSLYCRFSDFNTKFTMTYHIDIHVVFVKDFVLAILHMTEINEMHK